MRGKRALRKFADNEAKAPAAEPSAETRSGIRIKIPIAEGRTILDELSKPAVRGCERFVLALIGISRQPDVTSILVRKTFRIPEEVYYLHPRGSAWASSFTSKILFEGYRLGAGLLLIHQHGFSKAPRLSGVDADSLSALLPACVSTVPSQPHGSVVIGQGRSLSGKVWIPGTSIDSTDDITDVIWQESPRFEWTRAVRTSPAPRQRFDRLQPLIGVSGLRTLSESNIGIIGLCGGGSHVAQQLAHLGVGHFVLVDDQQVAETNLTRMVLATARDVGRMKTQVVGDALGAIDPRIGTTIVAEEFPSEAGINALKGCDAIFSCVDSYAARSEIMTLAWRHLIPLLDIGMAALPSASRTPGVDGVFGHCCLYIPGGPCMWCTDQLSSAKLESERKQGQAAGYVRGMAAPQVVSFNGILASSAVTELMEYVTGFLPPNRSSVSRGFILFDGVDRRLLPLAPVRKSSCRLCEYELGAGDPTW